MPRHQIRPMSVLLATLLALGAPAFAQTVDRMDAPTQAYDRKDYFTAHTLWLQMAEEGLPGAYFNLGRLYLFGEGVKIDFIEAHKWFTLADRAGVPEAKAGLRRVAPLMAPADVEESQRRIERWYERYPNTRR